MAPRLSVAPVSWGAFYFRLTHFKHSLKLRGKQPLTLSKTPQDVFTENSETPFQLIQPGNLPPHRSVVCQRFTGFPPKYEENKEASWKEESGSGGEMAGPAPQRCAAIEEVGSRWCISLILIPWTTQLQRSDSGRFEVLFLRHFMESFKGKAGENNAEEMAWGWTTSRFPCMWVFSAYNGGINSRFTSVRECGIFQDKIREGETTINSC